MNYLNGTQARVMTLKKKANVFAPPLTGTRQITILAHRLRIMELPILAKLKKYLNDKENLLRQCGFRKDFSTLTAHMLLDQDLERRANGDDPLIGLFVDLKAAFDKVDRNVLIAKLRRLKILN